MFKVNNKDTRTYFTPCSSVSIVNFEQVNAGWEWLVKKWCLSDEKIADGEIVKLGNTLLLEILWKYYKLWKYLKLQSR